MSESSKRGRHLEQEVAGIIRRKTKDKAVRDTRSGANWHRRSDIHTSLPIHIEAKDHATVKIKEWFRQAKGSAAALHIPVVAFRADEHILATLEFGKLIDLYVEIADLEAEIEFLRQPTIGDAQDGKVTAVSAGQPKIRKQIDVRLAEIGECRNGHLTDENGYCMSSGCQYARGYRAPKQKKRWA